MPRHSASSRSHLSWLEPASPDTLSPMQLLVIWLTRHYAKYSNSNAKGEMIHELCQGMRDAGYPSCTEHAIRSKIDSLRREARKTGDHRHSRAYQQYQQSLTTIFAAEDQHEDVSNTEDQENTAAKRDTPSNRAKTPMEVAPHCRLMNTLIRTPDEVNCGIGTRPPPPNCALDVTEIRRRFELLCARHALEEEGVAMELIDRILPLP